MTSPNGGLRVDELARRTDVSVRNIRQYQDRGLLPAPRREGRIVLYDEDHVVRLRLIVRLLERGYTLAVIRDLLDAWADGRALDDVLGLETVVSRPWGDDRQDSYTREELETFFGNPLTEADLNRMAQAGIVVRRGSLYHAPRQRLLQSLATLVRAGIPAEAGIGLAARSRAHLDAVATDMVDVVMSSLLPSHSPGGLPVGDRLAQVTQAVESLRTAAEDTTHVLFGLAMHDAIDQAFDLVAGRALGNDATHRDPTRRDVSG
jgi:DNA-binding transcriptional MerR regulator